MNEEYEDQPQQIQPPTIDQLMIGLMWEMQQLRLSIMALKESVDGLNSALREEE